MAPAESAKKQRVLVVYGSESGTCKRIAKQVTTDWAERADAKYEISHVCDGAAALKELSIMEDDSNVIYSDFTSLKNKYDVLIIICSSYGEGDPPQNYGTFFVQLLAAVASGNKPLAGVQHCVLGQGSTVYQETFQNVPRMTDRYLGECGSRRFLMRQEVDAAHYIDADVNKRERNHWRDAVFEALQALPNASAPPACAWDEARASHSFPKGKVTVKSVDDLSEFKFADASGATNEQAFGMLFWGSILGLAVAYGYWQKWQAEAVSG